MAKKITEDGEIIDEVTHETIWHTPQQWKTPFNHDTNTESLSSALRCKDPSKTQQHHAADADINNILRKFMDTGQLPTTGQPRYMDVETEFDLQNSMVTASQVEEAWNALPAAVRNILKNPATFTQYVDHCLETGDLGPLEELGLATKQEPLTPPTASNQAPTGGAPPVATPASPPPPAGPPTAP